MAPRRQMTLKLRDSTHEFGPRVAEFFSGIGLVRMGMEQAGCRVVFANDIDAKKISAYSKHFGAEFGHLFHCDIRQLESDAIPDVEIATASFPCTDLSIAGGRRGIHEGESSAFWAFVEALCGLGPRRPPLVLLENVTGFLTSNKGRDFISAMIALNELGYHVDAFVLDARWFVPQSRPRLFVVGKLDNHDGNSRAPAASRIRPQPLIDLMIESRDAVQWSVKDLPEPPKCSAKVLSDILDDLPNDDPAWWSASRAEYLLNQMSARHRAIADKMISSRRWSFGTAFRRVRLQPDGTKRSMAELRTDGIAGCLRTPKGGSGRQILFKAGYGRYSARLLTPQECARLMGADEFVVSGSLNDSLFGFGDAVCVPAIRWIANNYLLQHLKRVDRSIGAAS